MSDHGSSLSTKGRIFRAVENATRGVIFAGLAVPVLLAVSSIYGCQGEVIQVTLSGKNLASIVTIDFGSGITVDAPTIKTNSTIVTFIRISGTAIIGYRDVTVASAKAASTLVNGFEVLLVKITPSTGGGAGGLRGRLVPVTIIQKRKYYDSAVAIKVQKAGRINYDLAVGVSKRLEVDDSLALGVCQTLVDSGFLTLAVEKQADFADVQILMPTNYGFSLRKKAVLALLKEEEHDIEGIPLEEALILSIERGYNKTERKLYYIGGEET